MSLRQSVRYLLLGLALTRHGPFVQIAVAYSVPALLAAGLVAMTEPGEGWRSPVLFVLQSITTVVAPVVFMMAVSAAYGGERVTVWQVTRRALPWLPRYLWTNAHTSLIFWVPVAAMLALRSLGDPQDATLAAWWAVLAGAAIFLHSRTVLAPFLAVHGNLPGTMAAWESWRLSRQHLGTVVGTLLVSSLPAALPLSCAAAALVTGIVPWPGDPEMLPQFTGVALQLVRLTLVPACYLLYRDVWCGDAARAMEMPGSLRAVMAVGTRLAAAIPR